MGGFWIGVGLRFPRYYSSFAVPVQPSEEDPARWWLWPTILSLDAPVVVVLWQRLVAGSAGIRLGPAASAVLGCSVWLAYSADRWIEGWRLSPEAIRTHRHRFYKRWRWPVAALWLAVLAADVALSAAGLSRPQFFGGALVLVPVAVYLLSHQLVHRGSRWRAPKEVCVAALLGAGAAVFVLAEPAANRAGAALPLALFVVLCFSNCTLISLWEHEVDLSHGQTSLALQFTAASRVGRALPWIAAALSAALWAAGRGGAPAACSTASGALLGLVDLAERRTGRIPARVLADVALMTPLFPLILL